MRQIGRIKWHRIRSIEGRLVQSPLLTLLFIADYWTATIMDRGDGWLGSRDMRSVRSTWVSLHGRAVTMIRCPARLTRRLRLIETEGTGNMGSSSSTWRPRSTIGLLMRIQGRTVLDGRGWHHPMGLLGTNVGYNTRTSNVDRNLPLLAELIMVHRMHLVQMLRRRRMRLS